MASLLKRAREQSHLFQLPSLNGKGTQRKKIILEVQHFLEEREGQLALSWAVGERMPRVELKEVWDYTGYVVVVAMGMFYVAFNE
ncbi:hypothetical protein H5410_054527 [Solanum commersonii]|uniref:Uncharacterized protein n=1 Tax=Solanum commersonii TaxID=4109 RepID=A0A9J5WF76_SOLCO|nr:hypothetical protein H5410_054527 [Solanum commersonii]